MTGSAIDTLGFLIGTLFNLYAMVVALRFVMQTLRADYYNPISQFIVRATDPLLKPMRRAIPSLGGIDTSSLLLVFVVMLLKLMLFRALGLEAARVAGDFYRIGLLGIPATLWLAVVDVVYLMFNIFIFAIFIQALMSWLPNSGNSPAAGLLDGITRPVLTPIRRFIPPIGGLDLSAMVALISLFALQMFVTGALMSLIGG